MNIEKYVSPILCEEVSLINHPSGLKIYVCEKPDFSTTFALFGTRYGSIDTKFKKSKEESFTQVPEGIAHFLEHKLFESEDGGVFQKYSKTGGAANAYTSFDRTCYLFSCTSNQTENLEILLDFVQNPYLTPENVEKEKGIISQEIKMYDDVANWRVLFNLLTALYKNHSVRIDIAGTVDSIAKIDCDLLYSCYNTFYNPRNMFLCVVGSLTVAEVEKLVMKEIRQTEPVEIVRGEFEEPPEIVKSYIEHKIPVALPLFSIGFKEMPKTQVPDQKDIVITKVLLDMIGGGSSGFFNRMFEKGLINDEFETEYFTGFGFAATIFSGESADPNAVFEELKAEINNLKQNGLTEEAFKRSLKKCYGADVVSTYNEIDSIAQKLVDVAMNGYKPFDELEIYKTVTFDDIQKSFSEKFDVNRAAVSVILPAEKN